MLPYHFVSALTELLQHNLPLLPAQLAIEPQEANPFPQRYLKQVQECSPLAEDNALLPWPLSSLEVFNELCHLRGLLPVLLHIDLEPALAWACDKVSFAEGAAADRAWPACWSSPAREQALPAHPVGAWSEHRVIGIWLQTNWALGHLASADAFDDLLDVGWCGERIQMGSYKKSAGKLIEVCILLGVSPADRIENSSVGENFTCKVRLHLELNCFLPWK